MHGRKKTARAPSEEEVELQRSKAETYSKLSAAVLTMRRESGSGTIDRQSALDLTGKMIAMNPDFYSLWNIRREILCPSADSRMETLNAKQELLLSFEAILKNPKSYCAWHHRLWVASKASIDLDKEIDLCEECLVSRIVCPSYIVAKLLKANWPRCFV